MKTMTAEQHWKATRAQVDQRLQSYLKAQQKQAAARNPAEQRLWQLLTEVVLRGGKRLRPYLVIWAYEVCGGTTKPAGIDAAIAWELLHQGLLIHDDIIDHDYIRHGHPNVAGKLRSYYSKDLNEADRNHYADSGALLAGDLALSSAYQLLLGAGFPADRTAHACRILGESTATVIGGELLDTEAVLEPFGTTNYLLIAERKTASYSFVGPLQCGAALAGANASTLAKLAELGNALGIAFQLADDLLGLFGDPAVTGKPNDSDIREGKRTLLLQYTLEAASPKEVTFIKQVAGKTTATASEINRFRTLVEKTGARAKVEQQVNDYLDQADAAVGRLAMPDPTHQDRYDFWASKLRQRKL